MPLVLGTLDFGYYFYVGANAEDAARVGINEAVRVAAGGPCNFATTAAVQLKGPATAVGSGIGCVGGAAYCYMNEPPLNMGGPGSPKITDVFIECLPGPPPTMWRIT